MTDIKIVASGTCAECGHNQKETFSVEIESSDSYMDFD